MKKHLPLIISLFLIGNAIAIPAIQLSQGTIAAAEGDSETTATSIADSNVYWDIYKMFSDKYISNWNEQHPDNQITTFNPFFLSPNYGDYHGSSYKGKLLSMYPYQNDMYIYTWLDTSDIASDVWDGQSIHVLATSNVERNETGYLDDGSYIDYKATLVNTYNLSAGSKNNWLGKWVIKDVVDTSATQDFFRFKVESMYLAPVLSDTVINLGTNLSQINLKQYQTTGYYVYKEGPVWYARKIIGHVRDVDCGDELIYTAADSLNDFNYHYSQPDYINITSKTGSLLLMGKDLPGYQSYFESDPNNAGNSMGYSKYDENFYCFFNVGSYSIDSKVYDEALKSVESITYSYNQTTYNHVSSQFNGSWIQNEPLCFKGLYDNKYLYKDAYFINASQPVNSGEKLVTANDKQEYVNHQFTLFWVDTDYTYQTMSIIDCSGDTSISNDQELKKLKEFVKENRSFDSDGDGVKDKEYRWAFRVGQNERTSETIEFGSTGVNCWGKWKSTCHQMDDITILRMKFINSDYLNFDLLAMDVNTPTTTVTVKTGGKQFLVFPSFIQDIIGWFNENSGTLIAVAIGVVVLAAIIGGGYLLMPTILTASASRGRKRE